MEKVKLPKDVADNLEFIRKRIIDPKYLFNKVFEKVPEITIANYDDLTNEYKQGVEKKISELYKFTIEHPELYYSALINGYEIDLNPEEKILEVYTSYFNAGMKTWSSSERERYHLVCQGIKLAVDTLGIKIKGLND